MQQLITQHSILAICLICTLEEANVPLPIPGDLLLVYAGALSAHSVTQFVWWLLLLTVFPTIGSCVLYEVVRRGGRPLMERYGRYIAIGPNELARSERLFNRYGWWGIAVGRSIPLVRHPITIACGLLNVPFREYLLAQAIGGVVNNLIFMISGALLGPTVLDSIHLPRMAVRLLEMGLIAVGLPALLWWLCRRIASERVATTRARVAWPIALASTAGVVALSATYAAAVALTTLLGESQSFNLTIDVAQWLVGNGLRTSEAYVLVFTALLALGVVLGTVYALVLQPRIAARSGTLFRQAFVLAILGYGVMALLFGIAFAIPNNQPFRNWWQQDEVEIVITTLLATLSYAFTTVCGHTLAVALVGNKT